MAESWSAMLRHGTSTKMSEEPNLNCVGGHLRSCNWFFFFFCSDFRIKQCTRVTQEDFITVNHEMGHTQYQMSYRNHSFLYRSGANPGFHEGVADIISLAVGERENPSKAD